MPINIAIEDDLKPFKELLREKGYNVSGISSYQTADAIIVSGMDANIMNRQDALTKVPIIRAEGKSPDEVLRELEDKLGY